MNDKIIKLLILIVAFTDFLSQLSQLYIGWAELPKYQLSFFLGYLYGHNIFQVVKPGLALITFLTSWASPVHRITIPQFSNCFVPQCSHLRWSKQVVLHMLNSIAAQNHDQEFWFQQVLLLDLTQDLTDQSFQILMSQAQEASLEEFLYSQSLFPIWKSKRN